MVDALDKLSDIAYDEAKDEITDYTIYSSLSRIAKNPKTKMVFSELSRTEHSHYNFWMGYSRNRKIRPNALKVYLVILMHYLMGGAFVIKYLEKGETSTIKKYKSLERLVPKKDLPRFRRIIIDEEHHELMFASQIQGSYVKYISFIVLGLADALVEIAGIHAGSLGIYDSTKLTGLAGIVAGAAASIAMASAAYAQAKQGFKGSAALAAGYTGISYFISAVILALPYFLTETMLIAITSSVILGMAIIATVSWYNSVISESSFRRDFAELAGIMVAATIVLFLFGIAIRGIFHISI
ncbi:MAG: rubrerythrin family protein [Candidatus Micrarchaeota archaeon]|nr:rubrerythrin family protein [Candidatus Micrarchaeota archaeon]